MLKKKPLILGPIFKFTRLGHSISGQKSDIFFDIEKTCIRYWARFFNFYSLLPPVSTQHRRPLFDIRYNIECNIAIKGDWVYFFLILTKFYRISNKLISCTDIGYDMRCRYRVLYLAFLLDMQATFQAPDWHCLTTWLWSFKFKLIS